jgi:uncharacterized membrane protein YjjP (DUF1212 family)
VPSLREPLPGAAQPKPNVRKSLDTTDEQAALVREVAPPGIDAWRLGELEHLARHARPGLTPAELAASLAAIEAEPPLYTIVQTAAAVGVASGAFSYLNGGGPLEVVAAFFGGGAGQWCGRCCSAGT